MFGIFEVFMDTIVICTLTGLVILLGAPNIVYGQAAGAELTISGFTATYGGWVSIFTAVAMAASHSAQSSAGAYTVPAVSNF